MKIIAIESDGIVCVGCFHEDTIRTLSIREEFLSGKLQLSTVYCSNCHEQLNLTFKDSLIRIERTL